jgi:hypothetical protein
MVNSSMQGDGLLSWSFRKNILLPFSGMKKSVLRAAVYTRENLLPGCTKCLSPASFCEILFRDVSPCRSACLLKAFSPLVPQLASHGTHVLGPRKASATFGPVVGANNELQHRNVTVPGDATSPRTSVITAARTLALPAGICPSGVSNRS